MTFRPVWIIALLLIPATIAACGQTAEPAQPVPVEDSAAATPESDAPAADTEEMAEEASEPEADTSTEPQVIVGDVVDFSLEPHSDWPAEAQFGWVTFDLHEGWVDGESTHFIRTDASDESFADENGLVWVPLLANALQAEGATSDLWLIENGADGQLPVMSTSPADAENFTPAWQIHTVAFTGDPELLTSAADIQAAAEGGLIEVEDENIVVNYPVVKWPGGELPTDTELMSYLGTGQIVDIDADNQTVTFKLHECYSGARYIVTDTSTAMMAPMMNIAPSPPTQKLADAGAVDNIWVFANGIEGSGVMGYQPAVFGNQAGSAAWSPFWEHFTVEWNEGVEPRVLKDGSEVIRAIDDGELTLYNGVPDSHPEGFVVNCPVPILAANSFETP